MNARKSVSKLYVAKAHLSSVDNNMKAQAAQLKIAGALAQSTDVMKAMQALIKLPEMSKTMQEMSKEMMKVGRALCVFYTLIRLVFSLPGRDHRGDDGGRHGDPGRSRGP